MHQGLAGKFPIHRAGTRGGGGASSLPWQLSFRTEEGELRLYVAPALVNGQIPKIGTTALNADPAPYIVATGIGTAEIWCKYKSDYTGGEAIENKIEHGETVPDDEVTTDYWTTYIRVGSVTVSVVDGVATGTVDYQSAKTNAIAANWGAYNDVWAAL